MPADRHGSLLRITRDLFCIIYIIYIICAITACYTSFMKSWYSSSALDSGLNVLITPTDSPSLTAVFMVKTGSKNEDPKQVGISHFLEHFVFKGTKKYPSTRNVMRALDGVGAEHNAATSKEYTFYWVKASTAHLERAIEIIGEIVFRPQLPRKLLAKEKGTILQEIAMYEDLPMAKVEENFEGLIFGKNTPLGRDVIGTKETVLNLTRDQLVNYRQTRYSPSNCVFTVAGGVKENDVLRYVKKYFDQLPGGGSTLKRSDLAARSDLNRPSARRLILQKPTDQAHLVIGLPGLKHSDPRRYQLSILTTILGGNASSQLFEEIREKRGLAYYVRASSARYEEVGTLTVQAGVPPQKASEVFKLVQDHLQNFKFTNREFQDAKEYLKGHLALSWEESDHIAGHLAEEYLFEANRQIRSYDQIVKSLSAVTPDQIKTLAKQLFKQKLYLSAIGPNLKFN